MNLRPSPIAAAQRGMAARPDMTALLPTIGQSTLVIVGEEDAISRVDEMRSMSQAMPNSRLEIIPESGHMAPVENPQRVAQVMLDWLAQL